MPTVIAPHPDDEIIGMWSALVYYKAQRLVQPDYRVTVGYCDVTSPERGAEIDTAAQLFGFEKAIRLPEESLEGFIDALVAREVHGPVWAPDNAWDHHPLHKLVGTFTRHACRAHTKRFGTYSVDMNTPYLRELPDKDKATKLNALETCYPSQASLWQSDHKYFLFEGRVEEFAL